jgi:hypothetical protein
MVDLYNETGQRDGFKGMKAVCADLKGEDGELDGRRFDVILVSKTPYQGANAQSNFISVTWPITISKTRGG